MLAPVNGIADEIGETVNGLVSILWTVHSEKITIWMFMKVATV